MNLGTSYPNLGPRPQERPLSKTAIRKHYFDLAMAAFPTEITERFRISSDEVLGAVGAIKRELLRDAYAKGRTNCQRLIAASLMRRVMYMRSNDEEVLGRLHEALNDLSLVPRCTLTLGLNTDRIIDIKELSVRQSEVIWHFDGEVSWDCYASSLEDVLQLNDFLDGDWLEQKVFSAVLRDTRFFTLGIRSNWTITKVAQHESRRCCVAWMQFEHLLIPFSDDDLTKLTEEVRRFLQKSEAAGTDLVSQDAYLSFQSGRFSPIDFIGAFGPDAFSEISGFISTMWFADGSEWTVSGRHHNDEKDEAYFLLDSQCHDISLPSRFEEFTSSSVGNESNTHLIFYANNLTSGYVQSVEIKETAASSLFLRAATYRIGEYTTNARENPLPLPADFPSSHSTSASESANGEFSSSEPLCFPKVLEVTSPVPLVRVEPSTVVDGEAISYHLKRIKEIGYMPQGYVVEHAQLGRGAINWFEDKLIFSPDCLEDDQDIALTEIDICCITSITVPEIHRRLLAIKQDGTVIGVVCRRLVCHLYHRYGLVSSIADDGYCTICFRNSGGTKSVRIKTSALSNHAVFSKHVPDYDPFEIYNT